jgi:hypothetical protein
MVFCFLAGSYFAEVIFVMLVTGASAQMEKEAQFLVPKATLSPDGRYGVMVPVFDSNIPGNEANPKNSLVEMPAGRMLAMIDAETGYDRRLNHRSIPIARWSRDSSL